MPVFESDYVKVYSGGEDDFYHITHQIDLSPEQMYISFDGKRVYFKSNRLKDILVLVRVPGCGNYFRMSPGEIREHARRKLIEYQLDDLDI
jgi:hypothetical protein